MHDACLTSSCWSWMHRWGNSRALCYRHFRHRSTSMLWPIETIKTIWVRLSVVLWGPLVLVSVLISASPQQDCYPTMPSLEIMNWRRDLSVAKTGYGHQGQVKIGHVKAAAQNSKPSRSASWILFLQLNET